jgi:DNA repair photolyase
MFDYHWAVGEFRWSQLASSGDGLFEPARRVVGRGEYRGLTFHEVEARSIISKAPPGTPWFGYSINAYRGCSHACSYCLVGETPILMADGTTRPIRDIRVGDRVYGTTKDGGYRRFVESKVLDTWATVRLAYRVVAGDTVLVASADHRFLTNRGWKHVSGSQHGWDQRPHLATNNRLLGLGPFITSPKHDDEYRRGYLCGMIKGDGTLGTYSYPRAGRTSFDVHRFRLALTDVDALDRARLFLEAAGVSTHQFVYSPATAARRLVLAIRTSKKAGVDAIRQIIEWPVEPSEGWGLGFLAGVFDAEGSHHGVIRFSNTDPEILDRVTEQLQRFGFESVLEPERHGTSRVRTVRLLGGMSACLRFFLSVDPAITRKRSLLGTALKTNIALFVRSIEPLGIDLPMYDITTSTGDFIANGVVSHNCFARPTHDYLGFNMGSDFETQIVVKVNAVDLLRAELSPARWGGDHIAMGTNTDPYQAAEGKYRLTRGIIEILLAHQNSFSILTKSPLVLRDLELITAASKTADVRVDFSIATMDEDVWRRTEPRVPHPRRRMEAVARLRAAGIPSSVMMAPIIPGISDHPNQIADVKRAADEAGAESVHEVRLHLRGVRSHFLEWLKDDSPELVPMYLEMYPERRKAKSQKRAPRSTDGQLSLRL